MAQTPEQVLQQLRVNKLSEAYLFFGQKGTDFDEMILEIVNRAFDEKFASLEEPAQKFPGRVYIVEPTPSEASLESKRGPRSFMIRKDAIKNALANTFTTTGGLWLERVLVIKEVEKANKHAFSRLLKFLESLPSDLFVILTSWNIKGVPKTIVSRTVAIHVEPKLPPVELVVPEEFKSIGGFLKDYFNFPEMVAKLPSMIKAPKLEELFDSFSKAPKKNKFFVVLGQILTYEASNFILFVVKLLYMFYDSERLKTLFNFKKPQRDRLKQQRIDVDRALEIIGRFQRKFTLAFLDFEIQKYRFLLELRTCYG